MEAPAETKETTVTPERARNSLVSIKRELKSESPNQVVLGDALLDVSRYLVEGKGNPKEVEQLRKRWKLNPDDPRDYGVRTFQKDLEEITGLSQQPGHYVFYIPGSGAFARL